MARKYKMPEPIATYSTIELVKAAIMADKINNGKYVGTSHGTDTMPANRTLAKWIVHNQLQERVENINETHKNGLFTIPTFDRREVENEARELQEYFQLYCMMEVLKGNNDQFMMRVNEVIHLQEVHQYEFTHASIAHTLDNCLGVIAYLPQFRRQIESRETFVEKTANSKFIGTINERIVLCNVRTHSCWYNQNYQYYRISALTEDGCLIHWASKTAVEKDLLVNIKGTVKQHRIDNNGTMNTYFSRTEMFTGELPKTGQSNRRKK